MTERVLPTDITQWTQEELEATMLAFHKFRASPAYLMWERVVRGQIAGREAELRKPTEEIGALNFYNGENAGLYSALAMFTLLEEQVGSEIALRKPDDKDDKDE